MDSLFCVSKNDFPLTLPLVMAERDSPFVCEASHCVMVCVFVCEASHCVMVCVFVCEASHGVMVCVFVC